MTAFAGQACPYLGRCEDPENYYSFPTIENCCHSDKQAFPVETPYQSRICLGGGWTACQRYRVATGTEIPEGPVVVGATAPPLPAAELRGLTPRIIAGTLAGGAILLVVLFLLLRSRSGSTQAMFATFSPTPAEVGMAWADELTPTPPSVTPAPTASPSLAPTNTPRPTVTRTPTPTPSSIPSDTATPTRTPSPTSTWTPAPTSTPTLMPSPTAALTAGPAATSTPLPAPVLVAPPDGQAYSLGEEVLLDWMAVPGLPVGDYYAVTVAYVHLGETWYDDVPWTQSTSWALSDHEYLLDLTDDSWFSWSVQAMRQTDVDADGNPVGVALSPSSEVWTLRWMGQDGGEAPTPVPQPPTPTATQKPTPLP